ncbi:MAG: hypothetical protein IPJ26_14055 [Bacteroidetes bacterium]|nr:hypothetical protein [Bacteroidota bacterium]
MSFYQTAIPWAGILAATNAGLQSGPALALEPTLALAGSIDANGQGVISVVQRKYCRLTTHPNGTTILWTTSAEEIFLGAPSFTQVASTFLTWWVFPLQEHKILVRLQRLTQDVIKK